MDRCIYSAMWILDLMAGRVLIWRTDTLHPVPAIQKWLCQFDSTKIAQVKCAKKVFQLQFSTCAIFNYVWWISTSKLQCSHTRIWHLLWRKSASRLQAAAQPYRVSPVIGQPGSPCKTAVEPTFCGTKFLVLAIWLRDLFFFLGFIPKYCIPSDPLTSVIWRLCSEFYAAKDEFGAIRKIRTPCPPNLNGSIIHRIFYDRLSRGTLGKKTPPCCLGCSMGWRSVMPWHCSSYRWATGCWFFGFLQCAVYRSSFSVINALVGAALGGWTSPVWVDWAWEVNRGMPCYGAVVWGREMMFFDI